MKCASCKMEKDESQFVGLKGKRVKTCRSCRAANSVHAIAARERKFANLRDKYHCDVCGQKATERDAADRGRWDTMRHGYLTMFKGMAVCSNCMCGEWHDTPSKNIESMFAVIGDGGVGVVDYGERFTVEEHRRWNKNLKALQERLRDEARITTAH